MAIFDKIFRNNIVLDVKKILGVFFLLLSQWVDFIQNYHFWNGNRGRMLKGPPLNPWTYISR